MKIKVKFKVRTSVTTKIKTVPSTPMTTSALIAVLGNGRKREMPNARIVFRGCTKPTLGKTHAYLAGQACGAIALVQIQTLLATHARRAIIPLPKVLRTVQHATRAHQENLAM